MKSISFFFWIAAILSVAVMVCQPIGVDSHITFSFGSIIIMMTIHILGLKGFARQIFLVLGFAMALRYLYWRATSTLPPVDDLASFIPGLILFAAEIYTIGMLFINLIVITDPLDRSHVPLPKDRSLWPTVDVFIPSYNEDEDILGTTLAAAANLDYPADKLRVYLLDDGGTDQKCMSSDMIARNEACKRRSSLQKLCSELGITYLTRPRNEHAKAGNMNEALRHTSGEFILVLDADHAPVQEFLKRTVGQFLKDQRLFLVQTPHFFLNADPIEKNLGTFSFMPSENEMFYSVMQKGLDKWGGSFFCGSGAVLRRKALAEAGGFSGITITEDCETALELHSRGWKSAYVDEPLFAGFQPETVSSFMAQRTRWCQGMLQILLLKRPFLKKGLSPAQRLSYMSSTLFWLFPVSRLIFMLAPVLYIFFGLEIFNASFREFIAYTGLFMICSSVMQNYVFGSVRWPWISELYEYVQSIYLTKAIFSVLFNPRHPTFKVTDKGTTIEDDHFSSLGWPYLAMFGLMLATSLLAGIRLWQDSFSDELLLAVGLWSIFNLVIAGLALGVFAEKRERRRHYRLGNRDNRLKAILRGRTGAHAVALENLAIGGLALRDIDPGLHNIFADGENAELAIHMEGQQKPLHSFNVKVCWNRMTNGSGHIGISLRDPNGRDRRFLAAMMLSSSDSLREMRQSRQVRRSVTRGTVAILSWSLQQSLRGMRTAFSGIIRARARRMPHNLTPTSDQAEAMIPRN